jgi:hypothetical protein
MGSLEILARCIAALICGMGGIFLLSGLIDVANIHGAQKVLGTVVDYVQEYTTRGFLWKAKVAYTLNNQECFHITKARTMKRGTATVNLYVGTNGKIYEKAYAIEKMVFGGLILLATIIVALLVIF